MGMTIDNADKLLSVITATITEDDDCFTIEDENLQVFKEPLLTAIDTMRKYQQIVNIVSLNDEEFKQCGLKELKEILEVIADGNDGR